MIVTLLTKHDSNAAVKERKWKYNVINEKMKENLK